MRFWLRRHRFLFHHHRHYAGRMLPVFRCMYCDEDVMLARWQLCDMPWSLAKCPSGARLTLLECLDVLLGRARIDCYGWRDRL